jgi:hypothetical protein
MVIDTSAVIAVLFHEANSPLIGEAIESGGKHVADSVGDGRGRGDGAALTHALHAVFGVGGGGVQMPDPDRRHLGRDVDQPVPRRLARRQRFPAFVCIDGWLW